MKYSAKSVLSSGIVIGKIHKIESNQIEESLDLDDYEKLNNAIDKSLAQLAEMKKKSPELTEYILVQEFMINDPELKKRILLLLDQGIPVNKAITAVMQEFIQGLASSASGYLQERTNDMEDASRRLLMNLSDSTAKEPEGFFILSTDKPYPSYLIHHREKILGIISKTGGYTSHTAILCRGYDIPFVTCDGEFTEGEEVIIDTRKKMIITAPTGIQKAMVKKENGGKKKAVLHAGFKFYANAASASDVSHAMEYGFDGIGLFRTEMIFMNSNRPLTAIEQYKVYKEAVDSLKPDASIVFRTFDVGGDKQIAYVHTHTKGIDNYKKNPYIFENQIMAILKIYTDTEKDIRIMFPMIFDPEEFIYLKEWVKNLASRFGYSVPKIGMMLETKEALARIREFKGVEFISVGTNDLVKSLYNLDRETSVDAIDTYKEDLLHRLVAAKEYAERREIPISVCGELASVPDIAMEFYKIGIKNLSVSPSLIRMLNQAYTEFVERTIK